MLNRRIALVTLALITSSLAGLAWTRQPDAPKGEPASPAAPGSTTAEKTTVALTIDYRDGTEKSFTRLAHSTGMTVFDAMVRARDLPSPRAISFVSTGSGETAFIKQIDELKNQGGGKSALNWQYTINGKLGTVGVGAAKLKPGDVVRWVYDVYKMP